MMSTRQERERLRREDEAAMRTPTNGSNDERFVAPSTLDRGVGVALSGRIGTPFQSPRPGSKLRRVAVGRTRERGEQARRSSGRVGGSPTVHPAERLYRRLRGRRGPSSPRVLVAVLDDATDADAAVHRSGRRAGITRGPRRLIPILDVRRVTRRRRRTSRGACAAASARSRRDASVDVSPADGSYAPGVSLTRAAR